MKDSIYSAKPGNIYAVLQDEMPEEEEVIKPPTSLVDMPDEILVKIFRLALNSGREEPKLSDSGIRNRKYSIRATRSFGDNFDCTSGFTKQRCCPEDFNYSRAYRTAGFKFNQHLWDVAQEEFINTNVFTVETHPRVCNAEKFKGNQPYLLFQTTPYRTDFCLRLQNTFNTLHETTSGGAQFLKDLVHVDFKLDHGLLRQFEMDLPLLADFAEFVAPRLKSQLPKMRTMSLWIHGEEIEYIARAKAWKPQSANEMAPLITRIIKAFMTADIPLISVSTRSYLQHAPCRHAIAKVQDVRGWSAEGIAKELCQEANFSDWFELK